MAQTLKGALSTERQATPYEKFRDTLEKTQAELLPLLGSPDQVKRFVRVVLNAVHQNPKLIDPETDRRSLLLACMRAAQDRLLPDGREAVLNIYRTKKKVDGVERWIPIVQYLPMVQGLVKKLYEGGEVTYVDAVAVYHKDQFEYERGDNPRIVHKPYDGDDDPGPVRAAYLIAKLKGGEIKREVMWRRDIEAVRKSSQVPDGGAWKDWYDQQAIKSVIKRGYKQLPRSEEFEAVAAADNEAMHFSFGGGAFDQEQPPALPDGREEQRERTIEHGPIKQEEKEPAKREEPVKEQQKAPAKPSPRKAPPSATETIRLGIEGATTQEELDPILAAVSGLVAGAERDELLNKWHAKSQQLKPITRGMTDAIAAIDGNDLELAEEIAAELDRKGEKQDAAAIRQTIEDVKTAIEAQERTRSRKLFPGG